MIFSERAQKAIDEKLTQLRGVKQGTLTPGELADLITDRRMGWILEHRGEMLAKYDGLSPEEQAYRIVCFDHMGIKPEHNEMIRISPGKIRFNSYNFCPYLEACKQLDLDTRFVCKEIGEPSIQRMIQVIHPKLRFSRNYANIRPHNTAFCEEYMEIVDA